jgi:D-alanine-D-alanine ligase
MSKARSSTFRSASSRKASSRSGSCIVGVVASTPQASELRDPATWEAYAAVGKCGEEAIAALREGGHEPFLVSVHRDPEAAIAELRGRGAEVVVNLVEEIGGDAGQEARFADLLEESSLPYTGSSGPVLRCTLDKAETKRVLERAGVRVPRWAAFARGAEVEWPAGAFPAIVKPAREDGSVGIDRGSVCPDVDAVRRRVDRVASVFRQPAIVEQFIDGRELCAGFLEGHRLPISEIEFASGAPRVVTFESKWSPGSEDDLGTRPVCPARLEDDEEASIRAIAQRALRALGVRDYGRVDLRVDEAGVPHVLEVNANPDLSSQAGFVRAARHSGLELPELYGRLVALARCRSGLAVGELR